MGEISFWWFSHSTQLLPADSFVVDDHLGRIGEHQNLGGRIVAFVVLLFAVSLLLSLRQGRSLSAESASSNCPLLAANVDSAGRLPLEALLEALALLLAPSTALHSLSSLERLFFSPYLAVAVPTSRQRPPASASCASLPLHHLRF